MDSKLQFIKNTCFYALLLVLYYLAVKYALPFLFPVICSFATVYLLNIPAKWLHEKFSLSIKASRLYLVSLLFLGIGLLGFVIIHFGMPVLQGLSTSVPQFYTHRIVPALDAMQNAVMVFLQKFSLESSIEVSQIFDPLKEQLLTLITDIGTKFALAVGKSLPGAALSLSFYFICTYLFAADFDKVKRAPLKFFPTKIKKNLRTVFFQMTHSLFGMLKATLQLMAITFGILWIGLFAIGIKKSLMWALFISFIDFLPVLGTGVVMVPWGIFKLMDGNVFGGASILLLYGVIWAVRSILDPKLTGKQVGLHPALSLILVFLGAKLFGFWGIFVLPLTGVILLQYLDAKFDTLSQNE